MLINKKSQTSKEVQWKGINCKQSTRWQHLSQLKASAFFSLQNFLVVMKHSNLYLGLVLPSGGWQSLIKTRIREPACFIMNANSKLWYRPNEKLNELLEKPYNLAYSNIQLNIVYFSTLLKIRHQWQLKIVIFQHSCLICTEPF